jgi:uncharacterized SAM-dependent methyltransferase
MVTISNAEISRLYKVTRATVTHWVTRATKGENNLELATYNGKVQVIKNEHNLAELQRLKNHGNKHKNKNFSQNVAPNKEFYDLFSESQIIEIINNLKTSKAVGLKHTYLNGGARIWNEYHLNAVKMGEYPATQIESRMLCQSFEFLRERFESYDKLNIVDVGPGNGLLVKDFIELLSGIGKMNKYIAVDISSEMNDIALKNINEWYKELDTLSYAKDIETENIANVLFNNKKEGKIANIVLFAGGTLGNIPDRLQCFKNLRNSIDEQDILIITTKLDNITERVELAHVKDKFSRLLWLPRLLGINTDECDVIKKYNEKIKAKTAYLVADKDYNIKFNLNDTESTVSIKKDEEILIWQHHLSTLPELYTELDASKLRIVELLTAKKYEYILVSCESMF